MPTDGEKPIIWIIDENIHELNTHSNVFKRLMPSTVEIKPLEAYKHLDDYFSIIEDIRTSCIITDQKLQDAGTTDYTGIELAEFLRGINSKIPIYILTNFADDKDEFTGGEWSVEDIIRKSDLRNDEENNILKARILRRIDVYEDVRSKRDERLRTLIIKDMEGELVNVDSAELRELRLQKISPSLAKELTQIEQMEQVVKAHEELMNHFKHRTQKGKEDVI